MNLLIVGHLISLLLQHIYRFIRNFHETTQDPYLLFWDILFLCIGLFVVIGHWGQYLAAKKKKSENETPKE